MRFNKAVSFFQTETQKAIEAGYTVDCVDLDTGAEDGKLMACLMTDDGSPLVAVEIDGRGLHQELTEHILTQVVREVNALHKLHTMPPLMG